MACNTNNLHRASIFPRPRKQSERNLFEGRYSLGKKGNRVKQTALLSYLRNSIYSGSREIWNAIWETSQFTTRHRNRDAVLGLGLISFYGQLQRILEPMVVDDVSTS